MFVYLEYKSWDLVVEKLSIDLNFDFIASFKNGQIPINREKVEKFADLENIFASQDIFSDTSKENYLVDIQDSILTKKESDVLKKYSSEESKIYLYSSVRDALSAEEKRYIKTIGTLEKLTKFDTEIKNNLIDSFEEVSLSKVEKAKIVKLTKDYKEVENILDIISLSGDVKKSLELGLQKQELPVFMMSFGLNKLENDVPRWVNKIKEEEIQLGLALIFGKLEKQLSDPRAKIILRELVNVDKTMKTRGGIPPRLWWKLFLWKSLQV